jgi:hypothetical protein
MSYTVTAIVVTEVRVFVDGKHPCSRHDPLDPPVISDEAMKIVRKYAGGDALHLGGHDLSTVPFDMCGTSSEGEWAAVRDVVRLYIWARRSTHQIESGCIELGLVTS